MLRRGVRATPPASSQRQGCKCRADFSPRPATRAGGSPGIEVCHRSSRQDWWGWLWSGFLLARPAAPQPTRRWFSLARLMTWPTASLSRAARAGARGGAEKALMACWLPRPTPGAGGSLQAWLL